MKRTKSVRQLSTLFILSVFTVGSLFVISEPVEAGNDSLRIKQARKRMERMREKRKQSEDSIKVISEKDPNQSRFIPNSPQTVSLVQINPDAFNDESARLLKVVKVEIPVPKHVYYKPAELTEEEKAELETKQAEAKANGGGFFIIKPPVQVEAERRYIGTLVLPEPVRKDGGTTYTLGQNAIVFENGEGDLEIFSTLGHIMRLEKKFIDPKKYEALKKDLEANKENPLQNQFKINKDGDIVDSETKEVVVQANPYMAAVIANGWPVGLHGDIVYNRPIEKDLSKEKFMELLESLEGHKEIKLKTENGTESIFHLDRDEKKAEKSRGEALNFFKK